MKKTIFSVATLTALTGVSAVTANAEEVTVKFPFICFELKKYPPHFDEVGTFLTKYSY